MKTRELCEVALMTSLFCIAAPLTIPIGPIPLSLATLLVYLAGALLGRKKGTMAVGLYLLIGAAGLPVFSGFSGGIHKLAGVTGGYLIGYVVCAAMVGWAVERAARIGRRCLSERRCVTRWERCGLQRRPVWRLQLR